MHVFDKTLNFKYKLLDGVSITGILEDAEMGLWISTEEKGIYYAKNKLIYHNDNFGGKNTGINYLKVVGSRLFISNGTNPLSYFDGNRWSKVNYQQPSDSKIYDVETCDYGYMITGNNRTLIYNKSFSSFKELKLKTFKDFISIGLKKIVKIKDNELMGFQNNYLFEKTNGLFLKGIHLKDLPKVRDLHQLVSNKFLLSTVKGVFIVADLDKNRNDFYKKSYLIYNSEKVEKIFISSQKDYWLLPLSDSIHILDSNFHSKKTIALKEKDQHVRSVLEINPLCFLIASDKGLYYITFNNNSYETFNYDFFDQTNGLNSSDIYNIVHFKNDFYVSTAKGICFFSQVDFLRHKKTPQTIINRINVNDIVTKKDSSVFSFHNNNISFTVDALTYKKVNQKGVFFKYKLDGFDTEFKEADGYTITYTNLSPGKYRFLAKAFYDDQTEDETPAVYVFEIKPAFWQTWWGIGLIILCLGFFIFLFIQWRLKVLQQKETEKTKIKQTLAEYKFTALRAQMNPHFLFNSINVIQNLILEKDKKEAYQSLSNFSKTIRMILHQSDSMYATIGEEMELINAFVDLNKQRVEYPFDFITEIEADTYGCLIPSLIVQPLVENAIWHGIIPLRGNKLGLIKLSIQFIEENIIRIQVSDNGIGRNEAAKNKVLSNTHLSKGIALIEERLKAYSEINHNCIATIEYFDFDKNGDISTLVEIKIQPLDDEQ